MADAANRGTNVVVIGGGVAGSLLAKSLQFDSNLVLIDPKEYFDVPWTDLRSMVEPTFAEKTLIKHSEYFSNGTIVNSRAIDITATEVLTEEGRAVPYDYLVVATGHDDPLPRSKTDRIGQFKQDYEKIKSSSSILIIGGGPTGVELAGEIATDFPDKKVTLVHKGERLIEFIGLKASTKALKWLKSKKVEVLLGQTVDLDSVPEGSREFKTSAGTTVSADSYFVCIGKPLSSAWLRGTILKDSLDEHGRVKVDDKLRVRGQDKIFAIGDINDVKELKQGYLAQEHATLVAKNIKSLMKGGKESSLAPYKPGSAMAIVSLGRKSAVAQFPFMTASGRFPGMIKSKDLFIGRTRKLMGVDP
ncbi:FAD/NAD(P)-binding oxidoreductase family protein [Rhynchospora pubera]|uniref:FAD/NAD(P)-binding oxidoreductase family protein n=1 Tax=Rhynchospora pubera TaxID=906938 RepID=A0AAV8CLJ8_9POAL|nr:FAD/NAD(P)-binding oxidoreductase family protein [Rhynchospora pubera]